MRIFLGGTCNRSTWREELITMLNTYDYFNPVVKDWTPECQLEELRQREICEYAVYVITPEMTGVYSIAEAVDSREKTVFCVHGDGFTPGQLKSLEAVGKLIQRNGGTVCTTLNGLARFLNERVQDGRHSEN